MPAPDFDGKTERTDSARRVLRLKSGKNNIMKNQKQPTPSENNEGKKRNPKNIIAGLIFLAGFCICFYPMFANLVNGVRMGETVSEYTNQSANTDEAVKAQMLAAADAYNMDIAQRGVNVHDPAWKETYDKQLKLGIMPIMGVLSVRKIGVRLPVYHGTDIGVLQVGAGHFEPSSLPVGGPGTHSVVTAHTGLPSARMFTDLHKLQKGDIFSYVCLDRKVTYQVDDIKTVYPDETGAVKIEPGQDLSTLITCTPYNLNATRLLVRGRRVPNSYDVQGLGMTFVWPWDAVAMTPYILSIILILVLAHHLVRRRRQLKKTEKE